MTLQYTAPIFVALLSGRIIAEKVQPSVIGLVITAFAGIVLIVSPNLGSVEPNALLALGSGFFAALAYIYVRELRKTDSATSVVFWFAAFQWQVHSFKLHRMYPSLDTHTLAALIGLELEQAEVKFV